MHSKVDKKLFYDIRRLRDIKRCNNYPTIRDENVAEHSYYVTLLSLLIAKEYNEWYLDPVNNNYVYANDLEHLNVEGVIMKAMSHDIAEVFTGDIPWNFKHSTPELNKAINERTEEIMKAKFSNASNFMKSFSNYSLNCKDGFDGRLVGIADMIELAIYCAEEYSMGNSYALPFLEKCIDLIEENESFNLFRKSSGLFNSLYNSIKKIKNRIENDSVDMLDLY